MADARLLLEDGSGILLLEDGSGGLLIEPVTRVIQPAAVVTKKLTSFGYLSIDENELSAAVETQNLVASAVLDIVNRKVIDAVTTTKKLIADPFTSLQVIETREISAAVQTSKATGAASLTLFRNNGIAADVETRRLTAAAALSLIPTTGYINYLETFGVSLYGEIDVCIGPGGSLLVAGSKGRSLGYMPVGDPKKLYVAHERQLPSRPMAVAANLNYYFVLLAPQELPGDDGLPELRVYSQDDFVADEIAILKLPRDIQPKFLWAAYDGPDEVADFIIITGVNGDVQIRKADDTLELFAEVQTGVYEPRVVECIRQESLERTTEDESFVEYVWDILIFSERTAQGFVLQYRDRTATTDTVGAADLGDVNISGGVTCQAVTAAADLEVS